MPEDWTADSRLRAIHASIWFFGIIQLAVDFGLVCLILG